MTPTRTDGVDDFFEAAKDIRDQLDTFASTKSFAERLDSHEKMRARQRHRDMAEAAIKSQQLLTEQNRLEKERLSLLQREAREREEEKLRVSRLPRCPDCRSPIDGGRPSLCAQCRSRLLWILNEPVNETEANKYLSEPCSHSLTESICGQVNEAIESLRVAARAIPMSPSRKSYGYNELVERCEQIRHLWLTDRQAREKDVETQIAEVESSQSLALNKSNSVGCWWGCVQIVLLIAALGCFAVWLLQMIEQQTFANRAGSYLMVCLISVVFVRIISQSQVAWVSRRDVFDQKLQDLRDQLAACRTPPAEASAASVFLDANETVRGVMTVVDNLDSDWKKLAQAETRLLKWPRYSRPCGGWARCFAKTLVNLALTRILRTFGIRRAR
jgi:hypothetical protein